jgi:hypothetical protein
MDPGLRRDDWEEEDARISIRIVCRAVRLQWRSDTAALIVPLSGE